MAYVQMAWVRLPLPGKLLVWLPVLALARLLDLRVGPVTWP
jgi:hypothetical protein